MDRQGQRGIIKNASEPEPSIQVLLFLPQLSPRNQKILFFDVVKFMSHAMPITLKKGILGLIAQFPSIFLRNEQNLVTWRIYCFLLHQSLP